MMGADMELSWAVEMAVKGILILAVAVGFYAVMRRYAAAQRHLVLTAAMLGILLVPVFSIALPDITVPIIVRQTDAAPPTVVDRAHETVALRPIEPIAAAPVAIDEPPTAGTMQFTASEARTLPWAGLLIGVWALGTVVALLPLSMGLWGIRRVRKSGHDLLEPDWSGSLRAARVALGITRPIKLIESPLVKVPMTWGVFRSYVALPPSAQEWPPVRRQMVLCHELAHIKRRDFLTQLFARVACAIHWFNPLSWWAFRAMNLERERACDDLVIESGVRGPDYAEHLLQIARDLRGTSLTARAAVAMAGYSRLEQRVRALLDATQHRKTLSATGRLATACAILACVGFVAMLQPIAVAADEERNADDRDIVIRIEHSGDDDSDVRVIREVVRNRARGHDSGHHDWSEIIEGVLEAIGDIDIDSVVEEALRAVEGADIQGPINEAMRELEHVDIGREIEKAIKEIDTIELSEEDVAELRKLRDRDWHRDIARARRDLRNPEVHEQIREAREQLRSVDIERHLQGALDELEGVKDSEEWQDLIEELRGIDVQGIVDVVGTKLDQIDIEPILDIAGQKLDEVDVDALAETLSKRLEEVEINVAKAAPIDAEIASNAEMAEAEAQWSDARQRLAEARGFTPAAVDVATLLTQQDLRGADLRRVSLRGADLSGKNLRGALLAGADLRETNLEGADLRGADLSGANLRGANLRDAELRRARVGGANFRDADLRGADLADVNIGEADFRGAQLDTEL